MGVILAICDNSLYTLPHADYFTDSTSGPTGKWYCTTQAFFSVFGTDSSILWTIAVAIYMFVIVVPQKPAIAKALIPVFYIVCWGVPAAIAASLAATGLLGKL